MEKARQNDELQRAMNNIIRSNALERHAVVRCYHRNGPLVLFLLEPSTCGSDGLRVPVSDDPDVIADLVRSTDFTKSAAARVPEAHAAVLTQDREVAECLRACMGADASNGHGRTRRTRRTREWDMFVALHGLRPLNALSGSRVREMWRQFVHELEARPWSWWGVGFFCLMDMNLGWRANWHPMIDPPVEIDVDLERSRPPSSMNSSHMSMSMSMIEALMELDPWLTTLGLSFRPTDGTLCLHFTDVDDRYVHAYFSLGRKLLIPITGDLAAAFELLGYDDPSTTLTQMQYAASVRGWRRNTNMFSILCASRFFCPGIVQVSGGFKGPPLTRLYSYVRSVYGNDFDAATDSQKVELKTFMHGRAFDRFPELRREVELVKRQTEHVVRVSRIVRIDHREEEQYYQHDRNDSNDSNDDDVFVFLNGVLPLLSCERQTAIARFREFCEERDAVRRRDDARY